jgi:hypothetical protein
MAGLTHLKLLTDFFNKIGPERRFAATPQASASSCRLTLSSLRKACAQEVWTSTGHERHCPLEKGTWE